MKWERVIKCVYKSTNQELTTSNRPIYMAFGYSKANFETLVWEQNIITKYYILKHWGGMDLGQDPNSTAC